MSRTTSLEKLDPQFTDRWSPRAFLSEAISQENIDTIFEAARWSPSCFNAQPWRFVYATGGDAKEALLSALAEGNLSWAKEAPVIAYAFSYNVFDHNGKPNRWAEFDTGAAWMALSLQANKLGYHTHAMGGFDADKAFEVCNVDPETHTALCGIVIGKIADASQLPEELQEREEPSNREPLDSILIAR